MKEKAQQLIASLHELVASVKNAAVDPNFADKRQQLRVIATSIQQLESKGISVPDDLRKLKSQLVLEISEAENAESLTDYLVESLRELLRDLRGKPKHKIRRPKADRRTAPAARIRQQRSSTPNGEVTGKKPVSFKVDESDTMPVHTWQEVLQKGTDHLLQAYPNLASSALSIRGKKGRVFFTRDKSELRMPIKVITGAYVEGNQSAQGILRFLRRLLEICDLNTDALEINTK